jgi:hypothetical protein
MAQLTSQSINSDSATAKAVLDRFFSNSNVFGNPNSGLMSETKIAVPKELLFSISRYSKGIFDRPFLLPFKSSDDERTCWMACAHDVLNSRGLRDEMVAFVGPSFGEFQIDGAILSDLQEMAKSILIQAGLHVTCFFAISAKFEPRVTGSWQRYWQLLDQRPERPRQELRTFHQLRAAFDRALVARNEKDAVSAMVALRDQHGLSAENRAFLEIRLHAALGRWERILAHPQWDDLLKVRLPPETYGDIWDALYETYLGPLELRGVAIELIDAFAQDVRIVASSLLKGRGRSRRPAALKGFLLHELSTANPSAQLCESLLKDLGEHAFGPVSGAIASMVHALQPKTGLEQAIQEMELERYEQGLALLLPLEDSLEVLQALLRCVKEIGNPHQARIALDRLKLASSDLAEKVRLLRPRLLLDVEKLATQDIREPVLPEAQTELTSNQADDMLVYWREFVQSSQSDSLLVQPNFVQSLISTIEDVALDSSPLFESLLPIWFDWLIIRSHASSALIKVYLGFVESLHVRDRAGESEREMIRLATRHALIAGLTPGEYKSLIERLTNIFPDSPSPREISWALDLSDLLIIQPCRDEEIRLRWITRVLTAASNTLTRLSDADKCLLEFLAQEASFSIPSRTSFNDESTTGLNVAIENRIFLYSLDAQAIKRAARVLETIFPSAKIDVNSDETCTTRLRSGSRNADWVVFVSGVATHQAFYCIKAGMRPEAELLQVEGTGTTRIVERVILQSQSSSAF